MSWHPGQPVLTPADEAEWRSWRKARKLAQQRDRRHYYRRIDYYPSDEAQAVIDAHTYASVGGDYASVIDSLILAGAGRLPE